VTEGLGRGGWWRAEREQKAPKEKEIKKVLSQVWALALLFYESLCSCLTVQENWSFHEERVGTCDLKIF
jgi:hypothetical protein